LSFAWRARSISASTASRCVSPSLAARSSSSSAFVVSPALAYASARL
jgi:hypothetical protein